VRSIVTVLIALTGVLYACKWEPKTSDEGLVETISMDSLQAKKDSAQRLPDSLLKDNLTVDSFRKDQTKNNDTVALIPSKNINTKNVDPNAIVNFAQTLLGTPYLYGSTNPNRGFDCSGFITYVFNHFGISVPRSSIDFTGVGKEILVANAKRGDIILFTGTDPTERFVGHMGIVISNTDSLRFIHSSSGKANGVTITPLNKYYLGRFMKTIRVFPQNDR
jgi:cell wall-associated NlpC family hydrolase